MKRAMQIVQGDFKVARDEPAAWRKLPIYNEVGDVYTSVIWIQ
jgi:hypothetical protein